MSITGKCQKQARRRDEANLSKTDCSCCRPKDRQGSTNFRNWRKWLRNATQQESWTGRYPDGGNLIQDGTSPKPIGFISHIHPERSPFGKTISIEMIVWKFELDRLDKSFTLSVLTVRKTSWPKTCLESSENIIFALKKIRSCYVLLQKLKSYFIKTAVLKPQL